SYCAKTKAPSHRSGLFSNSIEHYRVVNVVRRRQILCTHHHREWIDSRSGKCGSRSDANPRSNANQDSSEQADFVHVNSPTHHFASIAQLIRSAVLVCDICHTAVGCPHVSTY